MKKIVGTIAAIALAASSAFAGVNVGMGFNPALFSVGQASGGDVQMSLDTPFGDAPRIAVGFSGSNDVCGVVADVKFDGRSIAINDNLYVWIKPASWLKIQLGSSYDDTLRGSCGLGMDGWLHAGNILNDDITFDRLSKPNELWNSVDGAIISVDPVEGLHIAGALYTGYTLVTAEEVFKNAQVQAGYTIDGAAQIKAQWIGWKKTVNAAVALKAVENMTLEAGVYIPTESGKGVDIGAFWGMPVGPVAVKANAKVNLPANDAGKTTVAAGLGADFDAGNGIGIGGSVHYSQAFQKDTTYDPSISFAVYASKSVANGQFGIAFEGASKTTLREYASSDFTWAVPFKVQVGF